MGDVPRFLNRCGCPAGAAAGAPPLPCQRVCALGEVVTLRRGQRAAGAHPLKLSSCGPFVQSCSSRRLTVFHDRVPAGCWEWSLRPSRRCLTSTRPHWML